MSEPLGTLAELRGALDAGAVSSAELVDRSLARAKAVDSRLHALLATREERARAEAAEADQRRRLRETAQRGGGIRLRGPAQVSVPAARRFAAHSHLALPYAIVATGTTGRALARTGRTAFFEIGGREDSDGAPEPQQQITALGRFAIPSALFSEPPRLPILGP